MTDEERLAEAREWMAETMQASRIREAKYLLENSGYTVLEWQTGEPALNKTIIAVSDGYILLKREKSLTLAGRNIYISLRGVIYPKDFHPNKWAYLPEGEQK